MVVCGRHAQTRVLAVQFFEIRSWSAAVTVAIAATGTSNMAVRGQRGLRVLKKPLAVLLLERGGRSHTYTYTHMAIRQPASMKTRRDLGRRLLLAPGFARSCACRRRVASGKYLHQQATDGLSRSVVALVCQRFLCVFQVHCRQRSSVTIMTPGRKFKFDEHERDASTSSAAGAGPSSECSGIVGNVQLVSGQNCTACVDAFGLVGAVLYDCRSKQHLAWVQRRCTQISCAWIRTGNVSWRRLHRVVRGVP